MTDKDNPPPGESPSFRRPPGRRRGEPPLIDASAIEIKPGSDEGSAGRAEAPGDDGRSHQPSVPPVFPQEEPVLFGDAARDVAARSEAAGPDPAEPAQPMVTSAAPVPDAALQTDAMPQGDGASAARVKGTPEPMAAKPVAPRRSPAVPLAWLLALVVVGLLGSIAWLLATEDGRTGRADLAAGVAALQARVGAIEGRPDAADGARQGIAATTNRLDTIDASQAALAKQVAALATRLDTVARDAAAARADAAAARTDSASARVDAAAAKDAVAASRTLVSSGQPATAPSGADVSALDKKVAEIAQTVGALAANRPQDLPRPVDLGPIERRLGELESGMSGLASLDGRLSGLSGTVAKLAAAKPPEPPPRVDLAPLERRIAGLDSGLSAVQATLAALPNLAPLEKRFDDLARRMSAAEAAVAAPRPNDEALQSGLAASTADSKAAKLAVAAQSLALAVDAGRPYGAELDALRAQGADAEALAPLVPGAARGVPTPDVVRAQWAAVRADVRAATNIEPPRSVLDRFASGARSVVRIRRTDEAPQDGGADAVIARIDAELAAKDLGAALAAWDTLPEAGKQASRAWADAATARLRAGGAADALFARALGALGQPKG